MLNGNGHISTFNSLTHGKVMLEDIIALIKFFLEEVPDAEYSLVIGTDSHEKNVPINGHGKTINLVTAILIHRKGFGGKYFWVRKDETNIHTLRDKIYAETIASLEFA